MTFRKIRRAAVSLALAAGCAGGFGATFANDMIKLFLQATAIANLADNAATSPNTSLYVAGHTASPSGGNQTTTESAYTSYARVTVARTSGGFTQSTNTAAFAATCSFPAGTGGSETMTHFSVGTASSGTGKILYWGTVTPNIVCGNGITPQLTTAVHLTLGT
jgi:hypothetical protein